MPHYFMFNKPHGTLSARKDPVHKTVLSFFENEDIEGLSPVGRLDLDTEGLLFLTDDGVFNHRMIDPKHHVPKTYLFFCLRELTTENIEKLHNGIFLERNEVFTSPAVLEDIQYITYDEIPDYAKCDIFKRMRPNPPKTPVTYGYITITEGKKHQIKRMIRACGCYVFYLKRVRIGDVSLDESLKPGEYRQLTQEEYESLMGI